MMLAVTVTMVVDVNVAVAVAVIVAITIIKKMMESLQSLRRKNCPKSIYNVAVTTAVAVDVAVILS